MNLEDHKSGNFTKQFGYKSFFPNPINFEWNINNPKINRIFTFTEYLKLFRNNFIGSWISIH